MRHRVADQLGHRGAEGERLAEIEPEGPREVRGELVQERAVHAELPAQHRHGVRSGRGAEERDRRVAGEDPHHEKDQHQRPEHGRDDLRKPPSEMAHARRSPSADAAHRARLRTCAPARRHPGGP